MWRGGVLATLLLLAPGVSASAYTPSDLTPVPAGKTASHAQGDYDGDGLADRADFFQSAEGFVVLVVRLAAAPDEPLELWEGEIVRAPDFSVRTAPPGTYRTLCYRYNGCEGRVPSEVTSTHDGIIVHEQDWLPRTFYFYWDGARFSTILIAS